MTPDVLPLLVCPVCQAPLTLAADVKQGGRVDSGSLDCASCGRRVPIVRGIPRFESSDNYATSFGLQWTTFRATQLDSHVGLPISHDRFFRQSRWSAAELAGKRVLDIGCGAGRFAEVALAAGARVVAIDYSAAVDACLANLGANERLTVIQANVFQLPIKPGSFDYVYCFGVLQHTPDPHAAVLAMSAPLKRGGKLALDLYPRQAWNLLWPKYWVRPVTRRLQPERLFGIVSWLVPKLLPIGRTLAAVPVLGRRLRYVLPLTMYYQVFPFTSQQHREWAILDTFDMLASRHDHPQTAAAVRKWLAEAGLRDVQAAREGLVVARAVKG
jgi:SAM-dependent methyltransferase